MKLIKLFVCLFIGLWSVQCVANNTTEAACEKWLTEAVRDIESVPPPQRFKRSLYQLQFACDKAIPVKLKKAASDGLKAKNPQQRFTILLHAASPYFADICKDIESEKPASYLVSICKSDDEKEGVYTDVLPYLEASSYLFGKVVEKELKKNELKSEIKETPQNELHINKFMLNYFLGAQLDYKDRKPKYY